MPWLLNNQSERLTMLPVPLRSQWESCARAATPVLSHVAVLDPAVDLLITTAVHSNSLLLCRCHRCWFAEDPLIYHISSRPERESTG